MDNILTDTIVPYWCFDSIVLFSLLIIYSITVLWAVYESVKWLYFSIKDGKFKENIVLIILFILLLITSIQRGIAYVYANSCWVITLLHLVDIPSYDTLEYGSIIQECIKTDIVRCCSHIVLYFTAALLIRRHRQAISSSL